ncbi:MAG: Gfo/Idh/MocA family oxidoreductase, partial [Planctomycetota bacterium]
MAGEGGGGQTKAAEALRIGICGLGRAGWGMIRQEVKDLPQIRIVAGCDVLKARAEKLAAAHGAAAYSDFKEFLKDPNTELVVIATRSIDHGPMTIEALNAGKNVLVEKPMAMNAKEAGRMIATAKKCGRILLVRHNRRFDPEFLQAKELIAGGKLGDVFLIRLRQLGYQRRNDWQTLKQYGGGLLFNWGPHLVDCGMRLLGSPAAKAGFK